jgi:ketosteroid isomerase-like protein
MAKETEMAAQAARTAEHFAGALIAGDARGAALLFATAGTCLSRDGTEVHGRGPIAALLAQLTSSEHRLQVRLGRTVLGGEVALSTQFWTRRSQARGREGFEATSVARLVLGRDGERWRILIASPWE